MKGIAVAKYKLMKTTIAKDYILNDFALFITVFIVNVQLQ